MKIFPMRLRRSLIVLAMSGLASMISSSASATDWVFDARVTDIEASFVPNEVAFYTDGGAGSCLSGSMMHWPAQGADQTAKTANIQGVLSIMTTALVAGKKVRLYGNNSGCVVSFIHLLAVN
jgi:hypothetical protein